MWILYNGEIAKEGGCERVRGNEVDSRWREYFVGRRQESRGGGFHSH